MFPVQINKFAPKYLSLSFLNTLVYASNNPEINLFYLLKMCYFKAVFRT